MCHLLPGPRPDSVVTGLNKDGEYLEQRMQSGVIYIDFSKAPKKRGERRNYSVFHFRDFKNSTWQEPGFLRL